MAVADTTIVWHVMYATTKFEQDTYSKSLFQLQHKLQPLYTWGHEIGGDMIHELVKEGCSMWVITILQPRGGKLGLLKSLVKKWKPKLLFEAILA